MLKIRQTGWCVLGISLVTSTVMAYETKAFKSQTSAGNKSPVGTHPILMVEAARRSGLYDEASQGCGPLLDRYGVFWSYPAVSYLMKLGVHEEDQGLRPVNHFYDPMDDKGLTVGCASPRWALGESSCWYSNDYSWTKARQMEYDSILAPDMETRYASLNLLFEALGMITHHVQDMAQPQHARLDLHYTRDWIEEASSYDNIDSGEYFFEERSRYEVFTYFKMTDIPMGGYPVVELETPRSYWRSLDVAPRRGMADFTNNNFVSEDTNFQMKDGKVIQQARYPLPAPSGSKVVQTVEQLYGGADKVPAKVKALCNGASSGPCTMSFYATEVKDNYQGSQGTNERASTFSIFNQDLKKYGKVVYYTNPDSSVDYEVNEVFTLNTFNFLDAHQYLLPRAVGYSAGLLNHFFRGKLAIEPPPEKVYAVADFTDVSDATETGFTDFRLQVANATPGGEKLTKGELTLVARYERNCCYQEDLSGEFGVEDNSAPNSCEGGSPSSSGNTVIRCSSNDEWYEVSISKPMKGISLSESMQTFTFDFSEDPIPVDISDLFLQLVYRGEMKRTVNGSEVVTEADGVVVQTVDISEPTHMTFFNSTDYYLLNSKFYEPSEIMSTPALSKYVDKNQDGVPEYDMTPMTLDLSFNLDLGNSPLVEYTDIPIGGYARASLLVPPGPMKMKISTSLTGGSSVYTFSSVDNEASPEDDTYHVSSYGKFRGINYSALLYSYKTYDYYDEGDTDTLPAVKEENKEPWPADAVNFP